MNKEILVCDICETPMKYSAREFVTADQHPANYVVGWYRLNGPMQHVLLCPDCVRVLRWARDHAVVFPQEIALFP